MAENAREFFIVFFECCESLVQFITHVVVELQNTRPAGFRWNKKRSGVFRLPGFSVISLIWSSVSPSPFPRFRTFSIATSN